MPISPSEPVSTLRGARLEVDARRAGRVVAVLCLVALVVTAAVLFVAGARKNAQASELHTHGVAVTVTVTRCRGLLGGSGSNAAGYACTGTYRLDGERHSEAIPGDILRAPGSTVRGVTTPGDPGLLSTPALVADEQPNGRVFIIPGVLLGVAIALAGAIFWRRPTITTKES